MICGSKEYVRICRLLDGGGGEANLSCRSTIYGNDVGRRNSDDYHYGGSKPHSYWDTSAHTEYTRMWNLHCGRDEAVQDDGDC